LLGITKGITPVRNRGARTLLDKTLERRVLRGVAIETSLFLRGNAGEIAQE